jgi:tetratricopeptide (TPR) repeat protein
VECCQANGDLAKLERLHLRALRTSEDEGDQKSMARDYGNLGNIYLTRHKLDKAEQMLRKALDIHQEINNRGGTTRCSMELGSVYLERGEYKKAEKMYLRALKMAEEIKDDNLLRGIYFNLGATYGMSNKLDKAEKMILKSLEINERTGKLNFAGIGCIELGKIYRERGDKEKWREYWQKAAKIFRSIGATKTAEGLQEKIDKLQRDRR